MFGSPKLVDRKTAEWIVDRLGWILETFAQEKSIHATELVLPLPGYFSFDASSPEARAEQIFRRTAEYCGVANWEVDLVPFDRHLSQEVGTFWRLQPLSDAPAGTFSLSPGSNRPQISYAADLVEKPVALIATFAHEISHLILMSRPRPEWIADEEEELLTDLFAVYLGFGVFLANSAFDFEQNSSFDRQGWSSSRQGYLSENSLLFATALFLCIQGQQHLDTSAIKPHLRKRFEKAFKQASAMSDDVEALRKLDRAST